MTLSDRVAVFNKGRVEQLDVPSALYDAPANPFVAGFLGDNNRASGTVAGHAGATVQVALAGGGSVVAAQASAALKAALGTAGAATRDVTLCIRPERLRVLAEADGAPSVAATVVDLIHQGDHWRMIARLDHAASDAATWHVKLPAGSAPAGARPGARVRLAFSAEDAWAF
jgi:putative spermidine/putrescine transport system ATP-binding protein